MWFMAAIVYVIESELNMSFLFLRFVCYLYNSRSNKWEKKEIFFSLLIRISLVNYHVENEMRVLVKVARLSYIFICI